MRRIEATRLGMAAVVTVLVLLSGAEARTGPETAPHRLFMESPPGQRQQDEDLARASALRRTAPASSASVPFA